MPSENDSSGPDPAQQSEFTIHRDERIAENFKPGYFPPKFDPEDDEHYDTDETRFFIGERRAGKTTLCTELNLRRRRDHPVVIVVTKTPHNGYWQQLVPASKIIDARDGFTDDVVAQLESLVALQAKRFEAFKRIKVESGRYVGNPVMKIIFEDCIAGNDLRKLKVLHTITLNGRHYGISCDVLSQDFCGLTPAERSSQDRWFVFSPDEQTTKEAMRHSLGPEAYAMAQRVWAKGYVLCVNKKKRVPLDKKFSWYQADVDYVKESLHKHLKLGNERLWGDIDVEEQKKKYPCVDLPALATLRGKFNEPIEDTPEDDEMHNKDTGAELPEEPEEEADDSKLNFIQRYFSSMRRVIF